MLRLEGDLVTRAQEALGKSRITDIRKITVEENGEGIVLVGHVKSFYHKQLAQELVRKEIDGAEIINHVQVVHTLPHG